MPSVSFFKYSLRLKGCGKMGFVNKQSGEVIFIKNTFIYACLFWFLFYGRIQYDKMKQRFVHYQYLKTVTKNNPYLDRVSELRAPKRSAHQ